MSASNVGRMGSQSLRSSVTHNLSAGDGLDWNRGDRCPKGLCDWCARRVPQKSNRVVALCCVRGKNRYTTTRIRCSRSSPRRVAEENTNNNNNSSKKKKKDIPSGRIKCPTVYFLLAGPVISWTVLSDFGLVVQFQLNGYKKQEARIRSTEVPH